MSAASQCKASQSIQHKYLYRLSMTCFVISMGVCKRTNLLISQSSCALLDLSGEHVAYTSSRKVRAGAQSDPWISMASIRTTIPHAQKLHLLGGWVERKTLVRKVRVRIQQSNLIYLQRICLACLGLGKHTHPLCSSLLAQPAGVTYCQVVGSKKLGAPKAVYLSVG